nr:hypothetical protein [Candidatus Freyrarchaeum guaymaensis]
MEWRSDEVVPIHAYTCFSVSETGEFHQVLIYDYYDPEGYYASLEGNLDEYAKEVEKLWLNMQGFLDEERNEVNGQPVYPEVVFTDIEFRGQDEYPYIMWVIAFRGDLKPGMNVYSTWTEEEELEYDCEALWVFPDGTEIADVKTLMEYEIHGNILFLWARKGDVIGGHEEISFILP